MNLRSQEMIDQKWKGKIHGRKISNWFQAATKFENDYLKQKVFLKNRVLSQSVKTYPIFGRKVIILKNETDGI